MSFQVFILLLFITVQAQQMKSSMFLQFVLSKEPTSGHLGPSYTVVSLIHCSGLCLKNVLCVGLSCSENPCKNGATCQDDSSGLYSCICWSGFKGYNCEIPPSGYQFHSGSYFKYYTITKTEPEAAAACQAEGARLARVPDLATHEFLKSIIVPPYSTWIGLYRVNGVWQYEPSGFAAWAPNEPRANDCTQMWNAVNFLWDDVPCTSFYLHYICEFNFSK
ncbi:perlucin-like protein [Limulus polyphemus]|uniref:Perlucin-like protein n=1 Tax=Limulus polyphemus TaxID=6850 RepID=A0ABM1SG02_LIMPO|nr:perlucin-like protein [Limulus polyphemus]